MLNTQEVLKEGSERKSRPGSMVLPPTGDVFRKAAYVIF